MQRVVMQVGLYKKQCLVLYTCQLYIYISKVHLNMHIEDAETFFPGILYIKEIKALELCIVGRTNVCKTIC